MNSRLSFQGGIEVSRGLAEGRVGGDEPVRDDAQHRVCFARLGELIDTALERGAGVHVMGAGLIAMQPVSVVGKAWRGESDDEGEATIPAVVSEV